MTFELRDYQKDAIDGLYNYWAQKMGENPLIVAPTGSGKTAIIAQIVKDAMSFAGTRVLILTHVKELLQQGADGLKKLYPDAEFGFYSASLKQKDLTQPITFGGIQSIYKQAFNMVPAPDLVIIDEAHMLPPSTTTRYGRFIDDLKQCNPDVKVVGLTATPYRLGTGYLHKGEGAIFDGIAYDIPVTMLMDQGYLAPVISKGGLQQIDLTNVKKRGGEFVESDLAVAASDPELVRKTAEEIVKFGEDRKSWLIFASGIDHAKMLEKEFLNHMIECEVLTGENSQKDRALKIERFKNGSLRCLININVLTTGFDAPNVDLIGLVRATASTGLYVQIIGRGTRICEGKENCLVMDYGQNVERHGFIDKVKPQRDKREDEEGVAPAKECPKCQTYVPSATLICPECGHQFPPPALNHDSKSYDGAMISTQVKPEWFEIDDVTYRRWQKTGKPDSVRVTYHYGFFKETSEWLCPDHGGYATSKYRQRKEQLGSTANTTSDAMDECQSWNKPSRIQVVPDGKYERIVRFDYEKLEKKENVIHVDFSLEDIPF
tara:strand:+ start:4873 stop:6513 length:1641 start_codon:yes stop_codon:yes gene_type:complete